MKKNKVVFLSILFFTLALAMAGYAMEMAAKCPLCGMNLAGNENTAYEITYKDGTVVTYCCPHCGLYEHATKKDMVKSARARCFISGEWMDPAQATYVFPFTHIVSPVNFHIGTGVILYCEGALGM